MQGNITHTHTYSKRKEGKTKERKEIQEEKMGGKIYVTLAIMQTATLGILNRKYR